MLQPFDNHFCFLVVPRGQSQLYIHQELAQLHRVNIVFVSKIEGLHHVVTID